MATFPTMFSNVNFSFADPVDSLNNAYVSFSCWAMTEEEIRDFATYFLGLARARPGLANVIIETINVPGLQATISPPS